MPCVLVCVSWNAKSQVGFSCNPSLCLACMYCSARSLDQWLVKVQAKLRKVKHIESWFSFPSNARWLSPGRSSSWKDNCIVQIHRINAVARLSQWQGDKRSELDRYIIYWAVTVQDKKANTIFFSLWFGRSRARSLHETKLLVRKLLHGRRWSHEAWQILTKKTTNTPTNKNRARRRSPSQICVLPFERQQSKQPTGPEPNKKNHKRFAKDTVETTHCVAINSKTCNKRISIHPETWNKRTTLLPREQQKSRLLYTVD